MKRSTLTGIGLSFAALALPASLALAQAAEPSSGPATSSISLSPTVEQQIRNAEQYQASAQARLKKADREYDQARAAAADLERKLHELTQRAETSRASLSKAASHLDEEVEALAL